MALKSKLQILEGEKEAVVWSRSRLDQALLLAQAAGTLPGILLWGQVKSHLWLKGAQGALVGGDGNQQAWTTFLSFSYRSLSTRG